MSSVKIGDQEFSEKTVKKFKQTIDTFLQEKNLLDTQQQKDMMVPAFICIALNRIESLLEQILETAKSEEREG